MHVRIDYDEIRFVMRPYRTDCFVNMRSSEPMFTGWRHKEFAADMAPDDILRAWGEGDDPIRWEHRSPPEPAKPFSPFDPG